MATTWTKLKDGSWGFRSTEALKVGGLVLVSRANGSSSQEVVGRLVWSGSGVWLYAKGEPKGMVETIAQATHKKPAQVRAQLAEDPEFYCWDDEGDIDGVAAEMASENAALRAVEAHYG